MRWTPMKDGMYQGKTLPQIILTDPDWFFWAYEEKIFEGDRLGEAHEIYSKARSIRVPQSGGKKKVVAYIIDEPTGKFGSINLIDEPDRYYPHETSDVIDMAYPRKISEYDKTGYRNLLSTMKGILFGDSKYKMTKKRCEEFFEDDNNFLVKKDDIAGKDGVLLIP